MSNSDSGHNFSRAVNPNTNNLDVDVAAVNALIVQRMRARNQKDFNAADAIIGLLLSRHGVIINDTDNTWKTGTKREIKKRPKNPYPGLARTSRAHTGMSDTFKLCPDSGPNTSTLSDEEVVNMVAVRRQAQRDRDYKTADRIRYDLKTAGVYVEDGLKEWRADGVPFGNVGSHRGHTTSSSSLVRSAYSLPLDGVDGPETLAVDSLLAQRKKFKSGGDYEKSDSIRDRLYETYNIRIDDRLGEWSVGGNFGDEFNSHWATNSNNEATPSRRYVKSATSTWLLPADEEYVQAKIDERMRAKRTRNFDLSDSIRDDLFRVYDVTIHDKINEWSVGGDFGDDESWTHKEPVKYNSQVSNTGSGAVVPQAQGTVSSPQEEISASLSKEQLSCLTVVQLKEKLRDSGARVSGNKEELINRLLLA
jgi:cysteinyl-tRNA synthetase